MSEHEHDKDEPYRQVNTTNEDYKGAKNAAPEGTSAARELLAIKRILLAVVIAAAVFFATNAFLDRREQAQEDRDQRLIDNVCDIYYDQKSRGLDVPNTMGC